MCFSLVLHYSLVVGPRHLTWFTRQSYCLAQPVHISQQETVIEVNGRSTYEPQQETVTEVNGRSTYELSAESQQLVCLIDVANWR